MSGTLKSGIVYLGPYETGTFGTPEYEGKIELQVHGHDDGIVLSEDDVLELLEVFYERNRSRVSD